VENHETAADRHLTKPANTSGSVSDMKHFQSGAVFQFAGEEGRDTLNSIARCEFGKVVIAHITILPRVNYQDAFLPPL
jgi:hypothetical protein